jgi:hypothetical protein
MRETDNYHLQNLPVKAKQVGENTKIDLTIVVNGGTQERYSEFSKRLLHVYFINY